MDGGLATTTLAGKVSTRFAVSAVAEALPLPREILSVETPPAKMVAGKKDLLTLGGCAGLTNKSAVAGAPLTPAVVCNAPAATVLT